MDLSLKGKRVIVSGGTRGIGRAVAETFAAEGANVAICARNETQVAEAVAAIGAMGVRSTGRAVDISNGPKLTEWIGDVAADFGGIDILVSNPGAMAIQNTPEAWRQNFDVDIMGALYAVEAAKPFLAQAASDHGDASIVLISTVSTMESDGESAYGPMKSALVHMAKGIARQHAAKGIRANVVSPGTVYFKGGVWNMIEQNMPDRYQHAMERNPTGRMGTPQDIANAVVFLASPRASYITGANLTVDGAITRRVNF